MLMSRVGNRVLLPTVTRPRHRGRHVEQRFRCSGSSSGTRRRASNGAWRQQSSGGGSRGRLLPAAFRDPVSLPWLAVASYATIDLVSAAYVIEKEKFERLMQRCQFHIATASGGEAVDLSALYDLLDWVYFSVDTTGVTALPKLLDAGILEVAVEGTSSSNAEVASLCREMLNALSFNALVAAKMAKNAQIRQGLLEEVQRHITPLLYQLGKLRPQNLNDDNELVHPDDTGSELSMEQTMPEVPKSKVEASKSMWSRLMGFRRVSGGRGGWGGEGLHRSEELLRGTVARDSGEQDADVQGDDVSTLPYDDEDDDLEDYSHGMDSVDAVGKLAANMHQATNAFRALRNVLRASQTDDGMLENTARASGLPRSLLWPLRVLYGKDAEHKGREGPVSAGVEWHVDLALVHSTMLMLDGLATPTLWPVNDSRLEEDFGAVGGIHPIIHELGLLPPELLPALHDLEFEAVSTLHEMGRDAQMEELLLRRDYLSILVRLAGEPASKAAPVAAVTALKMCTEFARRYREPAVTRTPREYHPVAIGFETPVMTGKEPPEQLVEEDKRYVEEAALTIVYFCRGHPRLSENDETLASAKTAAAAGFAWGALRRLIAWRQQGEHFAFARAGVGSVAPGRLPRVLASGRAAVAGGLKASFGAALLTALYGVFGVRFFLRDETLDAPTGRNGTVAMSCARTGVDLGVLYAVLRCCPYSLIPLIAVNASMGGLALEIDRGY